MGLWTVPSGNAVNPLDDPDIDPVIGYPLGANAGIAKFRRSGEGPETAFGRALYRHRAWSSRMSQKLADFRYYRGRKYNELGAVPYYSICAVAPFVLAGSLIIPFQMVFVAYVRRESKQRAARRSTRLAYASRWFDEAYNPAKLASYLKNISVSRTKGPLKEASVPPAPSKAYSASYGIRP